MKTIIPPETKTQTALDVAYELTRQNPAVPWTLETPKDATYPSRRIVDDIGRGVVLHWGWTRSAPGESERITVSGIWPTGLDGREMWPRMGDRPSISVACDRPAVAIAREIRNRLLASYYSKYAEVLIVQRGQLDAAAETAATVAALEGAGCRRGEAGDPTDVPIFTDHPSHLWHMRAQGGSVRIEHCSIPAAVAVELIRLCRKGENKPMCQKHDLPPWAPVDRLTRLEPRRPFSDCCACGAEYSANPADYWHLADDQGV